MNKKVKIGTIIALMLLIPLIVVVFKGIITPDKVLLVGHQVGKDTFEFTKEIKDKKKIASFENIFDQVNFSAEEWDTEAYPDITVQIRHRNGIFTHAYHIWIKGDEGIALIWSSEDKLIGRLSGLQMKVLREIIN